MCDLVGIPTLTVREAFHDLGWNCVRGKKAAKGSAGSQHGRLLLSLLSAVGVMRTT